MSWRFSASPSTDLESPSKHELLSDSLLHPPVQSSQSNKLEDNELIIEKGGSFLKNLYDYQGGAFIPPNNDFSSSPTSNAQLNTTFGVYLPCVQNIIGVIVFIRLYWVIGVSGIIQGMIIIGLCCLCTFLTAISLAASEKIGF